VAFTLTQCLGHVRGEVGALGSAFVCGWEGGAYMRTFFVAALSALLIGGPALAQGFGQSSRQQAPGQQSPSQQTVRPPQSLGGKPDSHPGKPATAGTPAAQPGKASTPESRSAAELALSPDPVFDDSTYLRIKQALFSYSDIEVRGSWPIVPANTKLAPGAGGDAVALLRRHLVITGDLPASAEAGDSYDDTVAAGVRKFQLRHGLEPSGSVGAQTIKALNVPIKDRIKQLEASL